jgi:hypothetical protein
MADTNTHVIMTAFLDLMEEPEARRTELSPFALRWINYGYQKVCDDYLKPSAWAQIVLDAEKKYQLSSLANEFKEVRKVAPNKDFSAAAGYALAAEYPLIVQDGYLIVPQAQPSASMWLRYYHRAPVLTMAEAANTTTASTIPSLIPEPRRIFLHFLAAAKYGAKRGKFATKAPYWEQQFIAAFDDLKEPTDSANMQIRNKYPAQPGF